jgi:hypothetical protein
MPSGSLPAPHPASAVAVPLTKRGLARREPDECLVAVPIARYRGRQVTKAMAGIVEPTLGLTRYERRGVIQKRAAR